MSKDSQVIKKDSKIFLGDDEPVVLSEDMSMDELLDIIKEENPAYANATEDNLYQNEDGDWEISQPKSRTNGYA